MLMARPDRQRWKDKDGLVGRQVVERACDQTEPDVQIRGQRKVWSVLLDRSQWQDYDRILLVNFCRFARRHSVPIAHVSISHLVVLSGPAATVRKGRRTTRRRRHLSTMR